MGRGDSTSFWKDSWIGDTLLKEKFPQLFDICNNPEATVAEMAQEGWRLSLRRWLNEELQIHYRKMNDLLNSFAVNSENDKPRWK